MLTAEFLHTHVHHTHAHISLEEGWLLGLSHSFPRTQTGHCKVFQKQSRRSLVTLACTTGVRAHTHRRTLSQASVWAILHIQTSHKSVSQHYYCGQVLHGSQMVLLFVSAHAHIQMCPYTPCTLGWVHAWMLLLTGSTVLGKHCHFTWGFRGYSSPPGHADFSKHHPLFLLSGDPTVTFDLTFKDVFVEVLPQIELNPYVLLTAVSCSWGFR